MALVTPSIMSTTTCFQLEELQKPTNVHQYTFPESSSYASHAAKQGNKILAMKPFESRQKVLLLQGIREEYTLVEDHTVPSILHPGEILVKVSLLYLVLRLNIILLPLDKRSLQSA